LLASKIYLVKIRQSENWIFIQIASHNVKISLYLQNCIVTGQIYSSHRQHISIKKALLNGTIADAINWRCYGVFQHWQIYVDKLEKGWGDSQ